MFAKLGFEPLKSKRLVLVLVTSPVEVKTVVMERVAMKMKTEKEVRWRQALDPKISEIHRRISSSKMGFT